MVHLLSIRTQDKLIKVCYPGACFQVILAILELHNVFCWSAGHTQLIKVNNGTAINICINFQDQQV